MLTGNKPNKLNILTLFTEKKKQKLSINMFFQLYHKPCGFLFEALFETYWTFREKHDAFHVTSLFLDNNRQHRLVCAKIISSWVRKVLSVANTHVS